MKLLITADPGARANFVAAWLNGDLVEHAFDVGSKIPTEFVKYHVDWNNEKVKKFVGKKIRIQTSFSRLDLHLYLFLVKNVYPQLPDLNPDQFSIDVTGKMIESAKDWFYHDRQIDVTCYDHVMTFSDTFDADYMIDLYRWYNGHSPSKHLVEIMCDCNNLNQIQLSCNHACCIAAMILEKEHRLNLPEIDRYWSLIDIYHTTPQDDLHETISHLICADNYGKSELHGVGVNERTKQIV